MTRLRLPDGTTIPDPRQSRAWQAVCAEVYATETHCWLCRRPVDFSLPPRTRWSKSVDHLIPLVELLAEGRNPYDRTLCRLAHLRCNSQRGARLGNARTKARREARQPTRHSRDW